jgi:hypothetical protein
MLLEAAWIATGDINEPFGNDDDNDGGDGGSFIGDNVVAGLI